MKLHRLILLICLLASHGLVPESQAAADAGLIKRILQNEGDPYTVLGVSPDADEAKIKAAYKNLNKALHPDYNPGNPEAVKAASIVNAAKDKFFDRETKKFRHPPAGNGGAAHHAEGTAQHLFHEYERAAPERRKEIIRGILRAGATLSDFHEMMAGQADPQIRSEIYHSVLQEARTPDQILKLLNPLGLRPGGENWIRLWKVALEDELWRFFALHPTPHQVETLRTVMRVNFRKEGDQIFRFAAAGKARPASERTAHISHRGDDCGGWFARFTRMPPMFRYYFDH